MSKSLRARVRRMSVFFAVVATVLAVVLAEMHDFRWAGIAFLLGLYAFLLWSGVAGPVLHYPRHTPDAVKTDAIESPLESLSDLAGNAFRADNAQAREILLDKLRDIFFEKVRTAMGFTNYKMQNLMNNGNALVGVVADSELRALLVVDMRLESFGASVESFQRLVEKVRGWQL